MKILILANNPKSIDSIKANIKAVEEYENRHHHRINIGDLASHEVHEISDVIHCEVVKGLKANECTPTLFWETDDPANEVDMTLFDIIIVYTRLIDRERYLFNNLKPRLFEGEVPVGIIFEPEYPIF